MTMKLPNAWMESGTDRAFVEKSVGRGLGKHITGGTMVEAVIKMANLELSCGRGHVMKLAEAPESGYCPTCKSSGRRMSLAPRDPRLAQAMLAEAEDTMPDRQRPEGGMKTGGRLDGRPITTGPKRVGRFM